MHAKAYGMAIVRQLRSGLQVRSGTLVKSEERRSSQMVEATDLIETWCGGGIVKKSSLKGICG